MKGLHKITNNNNNIYLYIEYTIVYMCICDAGYRSLTPSPYQEYAVELWASSVPTYGVPCTTPKNPAP